MPAATLIHLEPSASSGKRAMRPSGVLIVEDDPGILEGLQTLFEISEVPQAHWAHNAREALALVNTLNPPPSLILVDGRLPDCHGLELIQTIRQRLPEDVSDIYLFSADSFTP